MSLLDGLLLVACVGFAWSGYRQGFLVGVLSFIGFVGGGVVGMLVAPSLVESWAPGLRQALAAVGIVIALATVAQIVLAVVAAFVRDRLPWRPLRLLDSVAGALVSVVAVLLVSWFVASAVRQASVPQLSRQVSESRILGEVDAVVPDRARGLFGSFRGMLGDSGFPAVFGGIASERIAPVDPPDADVLRTAGIVTAAASVVQVVGDARACDRSVEGSGFVFAAHRVMTNAHVVAGVRRPTVTVGGKGRAYRATVVVYDPERDVAVLDVPGLSAPALAFDGSGKRGDKAVVAGFPRGGPYRLDAARIRERISARGPDIYADRQVTRKVFSLYTTIQPGNSGGPLLSGDGRVYGVVFAKSLDDPDTGYALTAAEVAPVVAAGRGATRRVDTQGCAA